MEIGEVKIALFADDTKCYISYQKSTYILFQHLHTYERASGAIINFNKSYGLLFGISKGHEHLCDEIKWTEGKIAALGGKEWYNNCRYSFFGIKKLTKFKIFNNCEIKRFLTLYGTSYIVKSVGFSTLLYALNVLHVPAYVITNVDKVIWDFIWDG